MLKQPNDGVHRDYMGNINTQLKPKAMIFYATIMNMETQQTALKNIYPVDSISFSDIQLY